MRLFRHSRESGNPAFFQHDEKKRDPRLREGDARRLGWVVLLSLIFSTPATAQDKRPPYWASIASGEAMMRSGPGQNYPGVWLYKRRDLPIRVVKTYPNWRLIEDPDGTRGWMLVTLLSDQRTVIVKPGEPRNVHIAATEASRVAYKVEHGVVGRIGKCDGSWCHIAIGKREGFIRMADVWGVGAGEVID